MTEQQQPKRNALRGPALVWSCVGIILFSCALDLFFYSGYYASDDTAYLEGAALILDTGAFSKSPDLAHIRLTIVGWNVLVAWLAGFNIPLICGSYLIFHQAVNLLTFALGRKLFDERVALLAMYCMATVPLAVTFSTTVLPDLPQTCFMLLSLLLFLHAYDLRARGRFAAALLALFAAGLGVGLAYMAKEAALILLPFYLVLWLVKEGRAAIRGGLIAGAAFALGLLVIFAAEWGVLSHLTGESYIRMNWTVGEENFTSIIRGHPYGYYPSERWACLVATMGEFFTNTQFHVVLVVAALLYPFPRGRRWSIWFLALWYVAYHTWGSTRLSEYLPPPIQARYFTPVLPLLFLIFAHAVLALWRAIPRVVRHGGLSGGLQGVFALLLLVYPLPGLHVCDRLAGKVYKADAVNNSIHAMVHAKLAGDRPIVLSGTVSRHLRLPLKYHPLEGVVMAGSCGPEAPIVSTLASSGFYYIELYPPRRLHSIETSRGLDSALHPLFQPDVDYNDESIPLPGDDLADWLEPQARDMGSVRIAGRPGELRRLRRFDGWHKRSQAVAFLITPAAGYWPEFNGRSAYLYEWVPRPLGED